MPACKGKADAPALFDAEILGEEVPTHPLPTAHRRKGENAKEQTTTHLRRPRQRWKSSKVTWKKRREKKHTHTHTHKVQRQTIEANLVDAPERLLPIGSKGKANTACSRYLPTGHPSKHHPAPARMEDSGRAALGCGKMWGIKVGRCSTQPYLPQPVIQIQTGPLAPVRPVSRFLPSEKGSWDRKGISGSTARIAGKRGSGWKWNPRHNELVTQDVRCPVVLAL